MQITGNNGNVITDEILIEIDNEIDSNQEESNQEEITNNVNAFPLWKVYIPTQKNLKSLLNIWRCLDDINNNKHFWEQNNIYLRIPFGFIICNRFLDFHV